MLHVCVVPHRNPERGDGGAPGTNLSQPGSLREALDGSAVNHQTRDGGSPPTKGQVHKDGGSGDGGAPRQTPRGTDTNRGKPGLVPRPPPGANTGGHHRWYGDGGRGATLGRGRTERDWLSLTTTLAPAVWGGQRGTSADCWRLLGVAGKWASNMGRL